MVPACRRSDIRQKLTDFHETLARALKACALRPQHNRRTAQARLAQIKADGYVGGYPKQSLSDRWRQVRIASLLPRYAGQARIAAQSIRRMPRGQQSVKPA